MAVRMNVQQAAVSKLEKGGEVHLSTVKRYVEALGASLRVDAVFPADARLVLRVKETFDIEYGNDDQLVFPLLADEPFRPQEMLFFPFVRNIRKKLWKDAKPLSFAGDFRFPPLAGPWRTSIRRRQLERWSE